jgi:hypothetical protein
MNTIWKGIMHLNAKAFCLSMIVLCTAVTLYCGFKIKTPPEPIQDGAGKSPELTSAKEIPLLNFVSNQLSSSSLIIPVDPFRPTIEAIFTNAAERAAFIAALKKAQNDATGMAKNKDGKKKDPFAHLRKKANVPGQNIGPGGRPMITPVLAYLGFIKRPDGSEAAMFYDSANKTTVFYDEGNDVHGVDIVDANLKTATLRMDDGSTRKINIGEKVKLAPEEAPAVQKKQPLKKPPAKKVKLTPAQRKALIAKHKAAAIAKRKAQQNKKNKARKQNFADR